MSCEGERECECERECEMTGSGAVHRPPPALTGYGAAIHEEATRRAHGTTRGRNLFLEVSAASVRGSR